MHLPGIGMGETAELQIENHEAAQAAVKEEQIHPIPFVVDAQPPLASDEGEVAAEFQQEGLKVANQGLLQLALGVFVAQAKKL